MQKSAELDIVEMEEQTRLSKILVKLILTCELLLKLGQKFTIAYRGLKRGFL